jgi:hypothetical protein
MNLQCLAWLPLVFSLVACASAGQPNPTTGVPTPAPSQSASASGTTIVLREAPANLGCDTIGIDYKRMTFRIDPAANEQVTATTDTGVTLATYWSAGFKPGTDSERAIRDAAGKVVLSDGDVLDVPPAAYPRLAGYFVCLAPTKLYVLLNEPS